MAEIDYRQEFGYICRLLPTHDERKALTRHLRHLNNEIVDCEERGEPTQVMQLTFDCLMQTLEMLDEIKKINVLLNGGGSSDRKIMPEMRETDKGNKTESKNSL